MRAKGRRHCVNKMDTASNPQSQKWKEKLEHKKELDLGRGNGVQRIMVVDWMGSDLRWW